MLDVPVQLLALGLSFVGVQRQAAPAGSAPAVRVLTHGAFAIASLAVVFTALPSLVFRP